MSLRLLEPGDRHIRVEVEDFAGNSTEVTVLFKNANLGVGMDVVRANVERIGGLIALASICYTATIVVMKLLLGYPDFSGWASLASLVTFLGGVQLMGIGVLGEYIGRIYMESYSN